MATAGDYFLQAFQQGNQQGAQAFQQQQQRALQQQLAERRMRAQREALQMRLSQQREQAQAQRQLRERELETQQDWREATHTETERGMVPTSQIYQSEQQQERFEEEMGLRRQQAQSLAAYRKGQLGLQEQRIELEQDRFGFTERQYEDQLEAARRQRQQLSALATSLLPSGDMEQPEPIERPTLFETAADAVSGPARRAATAVPIVGPLIAGLPEVKERFEGMREPYENAQKIEEDVTNLRKDLVNLSIMAEQDGPEVAFQSYNEQPYRQRVTSLMGKIRDAQTKGEITDELADRLMQQVEQIGTRLKRFDMVGTQLQMQQPQPQQQK